MREQFWGWLWWLSVRALGVHHLLSLRLEDRWCAAYWAIRPPLGIEPCTSACADDCPRKPLKTED